MTDQKAGQLGTIAKSWLYPAKVNIEASMGFTFDGFDKSEKAYAFTNNNTATSPKAVFEVQASNENPLHNPAFTIHNWKGTKAKIKIKGATQKIEEIKQGIEYGINGNTLVVWVKAQITVPIQVSISPDK